MTQALRVALASHLASPHAPTGAERVLAQLAAGLAQRGHQVTVLVPGRWCLGEEVSGAGVRLFTVPSRPCWLTYWEERPWPVVGWKALRCALAMGAAGRLGRALAGGAPQAVVVNCLPHLAAAAAARRLGAPWVWHLHEILPPGWRRRHWGRVLARSGARLVAVSQAVRGWVVEEQPRLPVEVVYNGVTLPSVALDPPVARRALGLPEGGVWVGFLGQLAPHKGVDLLLAAAARVREPDLHVLVAGSGGLRQQRELRQRAAALLGQRCTLFTPRPQVAPLLAACDMLCVPTLTPDPAPLVVLEGMAAGRVVIGSPSGGIPELIQDGETGVLLPCVTVEALAEVLARLAADGERRRRLASAARARAVAEFSLARQLDRMEAFLVQLASQAPARAAS